MVGCWLDLVLEISDTQFTPSSPLLVNCNVGKDQFNPILTRVSDVVGSELCSLIGGVIDNVLPPHTAPENPRNICPGGTVVLWLLEKVCSLYKLLSCTSESLQHLTQWCYGWRQVCPLYKLRTLHGTDHGSQKQLETGSKSCILNEDTNILCCPGVAANQYHCSC